MRALHAVWLPAPSGDIGGELLFWAEGLALGPLRDRLTALGLGGQLTPAGVTLRLPLARAEEAAVALAAPTPRSSQVASLLPSDDAPAKAAGQAASEEPRLEPRRVVGLRAPLSFAVEWLATVRGDELGADL